MRASSQPGAYNGGRGGVTVQDYQELTPDAETFARVWKRVMPDEQLSQIVVHSPGEQAQPRQKMPAAPAREGDDIRLRPVLEALDEGMAGAEGIVRRQPGAWPLREDLSKSAAQLRAAWMLLTGRKWLPAAGRQGGREGMPRLLREQYLWELRFAQLCREAEAAVQAEDVREIFPEQMASSQRRRKMLRHLMGRM